MLPVSNNNTSPIYTDYTMPYAFFLCRRYKMKVFLSRPALTIHMMTGCAADCAADCAAYSAEVDWENNAEYILVYYILSLSQYIKYDYIKYD